MRATGYKYWIFVFNGYVVDDHGNIRMPIIMWVNVLGFTVDEIRKNWKILLDDHFKAEAGILLL
jgi:polysaccharide export outer membrane protein